MIQVTDIHNCCGCSACVQSCPRQCIAFDEDKQGFRYPLVNKDLCIDCGLCEKVCPCLNQGESRKPLKVYAAINPNDEIHMKSSSGGIFTMLAETIIDEGGVVFGARFDENWEVMHDYSETKEGLEAFRGSKYVQSNIGQTYILARDFLKTGRKVLFSGTSCQIAGLKKFLRKEYDNLITVDVVCHGVPSPLVWREYLKELTERPQGVVGNNTISPSLKAKPVITSISFRDKSTGWKKYGFAVHGKSITKVDQNSVLPYMESDKVILHEIHSKNWYMKLYLRNLNFRPSCFQCPAKDGKSNSDITLADYWSIELFHPDFFDPHGVSIILADTLKGYQYVKKLNCSIAETTYQEALVYNTSIKKSEQQSPYYMMFWKAYFSKDNNMIRDILCETDEKFVNKLYVFCRDWAYSHFSFLRKRLKRKYEHN